MPEAVIVSTARTPIGRAFRGAFNNTHGADLGGHVIAAALDRAGVALGRRRGRHPRLRHPEGPTGNNIARQSAIRAGCPVTVPGFTLDRKCSSGLQAIALAAQRVLAGEGEVFVAGGLESISLTHHHVNRHRNRSDWLVEHKSDIYLPMITTADIVARRYGISREVQDAYALESQRRTAAAQAAGRFDAEIAPLKSLKQLTDKQGQVIGEEEALLTKDEGNRPETTLEGLNGLKPINGEDAFITAGNSSQLSDGASVCVVMSADEAARRGLSPLGRFKGFAVAGCEPDEMGVGPVHAVPKLLARHG
jgi:acetyl-CoA C-acetyltransferase